MFGNQKQPFKGVIKIEKVTRNSFLCLYYKNLLRGYSIAVVFIDNSLNFQNNYSPEHSVNSCLWKTLF